MKLAVAGKGGSGKTPFSGTIARDGHSVIAIDGDSSPRPGSRAGVSTARSGGKYRGLPSIG